MAVTTSFANNILNSIFTNGYIGLSTTQPSADGSGVTEPSSSAGYSRVSASIGGFTSSNKSITNANYVTFPEATAAWGTVSYMCVFDGNSSSASLRYYGALTEIKSVTTNTIPLFRPSSINVTVSDT